MKRIIIFLILAAQIGCAQVPTNFGSGEETWVATKSFGSDEIFYCKANKEKSGFVIPKCYKAEVLKHE